MKLLDKCQYLSKCALTPPLTKQQSTDKKLGLMLGLGRGMCAIAQILTLIQACYAEVITDAHLCPSNLTCQKTFLQKFRTHTCKYDDFRARQRSKLPSICEGNDQFKIDESTVFPPRAEKDIKRESFSIYGSFSVCHSAQSSTHCHGVQTLFKNIWIPYGCTSLLHTASVSADSKLLLRDAAA